MANVRRCPWCDRVTRIADDMVNREVICPECGCPIPSTALEINPYAAPSAPLEAEVERSEAWPVGPTSVLAKFDEAFRLLWSNLGVIGLLVLTVWLPGNLWINSIYHQDPVSENPLAAVRLKSMIGGVFEPIYVAGTIYVLSKRKRGQWATYPEALSAGVRNWGRLFGTRFIAGWLILLGFIAFLIPGMYQFVKFALIDPVVVLEGISGPAARSRSAELTRGNRVGVLAAWLLYLLILFPASFAVSSLREQLGPFNNMWTSTAINCFLDIIGCLITIIMFLFYWESVRGIDQQDSGVPEDRGQTRKIGNLSDRLGTREFDPALVFPSCVFQGRTKAEMIEDETDS